MVERLFVADLDHNRGYGPSGESEPFDRHVLKTLIRLAHGEPDEIVHLALKAKWANAEQMMNALTKAIPQLESLGIDLMQVGKRKIKLQAAKAGQPAEGDDHAKGTDS